MRLWARKGTRPCAVRDTRDQWAYLFGAVCSDRGIGAGLVMPYANTEGINRHLDEIAVSPGAHGVVVLDGAGWHGSLDLIIPDNITLIPLPPYLYIMSYGRAILSSMWDFIVFIGGALIRRRLEYVLHEASQPAPI
jgi:hypothetical protein